MRSVGLGIRQILRFTTAALLPRTWFMLRGPRHSAAAESWCDAPSVAAQQAESRIQVALTFDDGPDPNLTPRLLDALAELDCRATFFVLGNRAEQSPQLIHRIVAEGHDLGHHTYSHPDASRVSARVFLADAWRAKCVLEDLTGRAVSLFRPPFGRLTLRVMAGLWSHGATIVLWSCDPRDYSMHDEKQIERWCAATRLRDGEIVLLHDVHPWAERAVKQWGRRSRDTLPRFVAISDWLNPLVGNDRPELAPWQQTVQGESRHVPV